MSPRVYVLAYAILVILAELVLSDGQVSGQSCGIDVSDLMLQCLKYVQKLGPEDPPSNGCCTVVKTVDVPCACKLLTKDVVEMISDMISMKKAVFVARSCGIQFLAGTHCGSFTIPPA